MELELVWLLGTGCKVSEIGGLAISHLCLHTFPTQVYHPLHFQTLVKEVSTGSLFFLNEASLPDGSHWKKGCLKSLGCIKDLLGITGGLSTVYTHFVVLHKVLCGQDFGTSVHGKQKSNGLPCRSLQTLDSHPRPHWFLSIVIS